MHISLPWEQAAFGSVLAYSSGTFSAEWTVASMIAYASPLSDMYHLRTVLDADRTVATVGYYLCNTIFRSLDRHHAFCASILGLIHPRLVLERNDSRHHHRGLRTCERLERIG
jgi:hypothetical protein